MKILTFTKGGTTDEIAIVRTNEEMWTQFIRWEREAREDQDWGFRHYGVSNIDLSQRGAFFVDEIYETTDVEKESERRKARRLAKEKHESSNL